MDEVRSEPREPERGRYSLTWRGPDGKTYSAEGAGLDVSPSGVGIECPFELRIGAIIYLASRDGAVEGEAEVVHCTRRGAKFHVGFEMRGGTTRHPGPIAEPEESGEGDYYEILQISRKADIETIHRVFRIMAMRFHPDNSETGDPEMFLRMKRAYDVLSNPERRAEYDATLEQQRREEGPRGVFGLKDFVTGVEAEANRRLGVLCLLYTQRQTDPDHPSVSILTLEREMGFPREYLNFTMWYLRSKELVAAADNADYAITAAGADYVEKKAAQSDLIGRLLKPGAQFGGRPAKPRKARKDARKPEQRLLPSSL